MQTKAKVLLAEDDTSLAFVIKDNLEEEGYEVINCPDGEVAWEQFLKKQPDICLLDIGMPGMSGLELATKIRGFLPKSLLISISGWGQESDHVRSRESGFDHHLVKPVEFNRLFSLIDENRN